MKKAFILYFFLFGLISFGQSTSKLSVETEYQFKFSVGNPSTQSFSLIRNLDVELPYISTYGYPVNQLNLTFNYAFAKRFSAGLGFGFGFVKFEPVPLNPNSYYDKLLVPMYARVRYNVPLKNNWFVLAEADGGYQYSSNRWDYIDDVHDFRTQENGGAMFGASIGLGIQTKKYQPIIKIGYEFNQFKRQYVYKFTDNWLPTEYQIVNIYTYYNLLKLGVSIGF